MKNGIGKFDELSQFEGHILAQEILLHEFPVHQSTELIHILCPCVSVVDVIGVLPDVHCEKGLVVAQQRVSSIRCVNDGNIVSLLSQPGPPRPEVCQGLGRKIFKELSSGAPVGFNGLLKLALRLILLRGHTVPVKSMVPVLGSIIKDLGVFAAKLREMGTSEQSHPSSLFPIMFP